MSQIHTSLKRAFSISFTALAALIVLLLSIVPHHHHGDSGSVACVMMEHCNQNNAADSETEHNADATHNEQTCVGHSLYRQNTENRVKVSSCHACSGLHHTHLFPILSAIADFSIYPDEINEADIDYGELVILYTPAEGSRFHGLRAPPSILF